MGTTFRQCDESVTNSFKSDEKNCFKSFASENLVLFDSFGLLSFGVENILSFKEVLKFAGVLNFNKASRDMILSEDGDAYYRAELKKRLKGRDKSEWDKITTKITLLRLTKQVISLKFTHLNKAMSFQKMGNTMLTILIWLTKSLMN